MSRSPASAKSGRVALMTTWAATRVTGALSWRAARRPVARLWFTPWRRPESSRARRRHAEWLSGVTPISIRAAGRDLAGWRAGDGPTILLVHGWADRAAGLGAFIEPLVRRGFSVVGVDLPAHGESPGTQTNAFEIAEALVDIQRELGGVDAVVAHSIGALMTVVAMDDGLDVGRVVLVAPLTRAEHAVDRFAAIFRLSGRAVRALRTEIVERFGSNVWTRLSADLVATGLRVPALIVHDEDDAEIDSSDSSLLASAWPGARLMTTKGLGHSRITRDEEVVSEISNFLTSSVPSRAGAASTVS